MTQKCKDSRDKGKDFAYSSLIPELVMRPVSGWGISQPLCVTLDTMGNTMWADPLGH